MTPIELRLAIQRAIVTIYTNEGEFIEEFIPLAERIDFVSFTGFSAKVISTDGRDNELQTLVDISKVLNWPPVANALAEEGNPS